MRLVDLEPAFIENSPQGLFITLLCPRCGNHHVGVPVTVGKKEEGRWNISSTDFNTLTLDPSILQNWGKDVPEDQRCPYHFRIVSGEIIQC